MGGPRGVTNNLICTGTSNAQEKTDDYQVMVMAEFVIEPYATKYALMEAAESLKPCRQCRDGHQDRIPPSMIDQGVIKSHLGIQISVHNRNVLIKKHPHDCIECPLTRNTALLRFSSCRTRISLLDY